VRYANPAAAGLLGTRAEDLAGSDLWASVADADRQAVCGWWEHVLARPGERHATTVRFGSGTRRPCVLSVLGTNLLPDPDVRAVSVQLRAVDDVQGTRLEADAEPDTTRRDHSSG
jgi:hypothetical protein